MRFALIWAEVFQGLRRNASMVASVVLVTFVSLTFVGAAILMQAQIGTMQAFWVDRAQVSVTMCSDLSTQETCIGGAATEEQIEEVRATLEGPTLGALISDVRFETPEEAYENALELLGEENASVLLPEFFNAAFLVSLVDHDDSDVIQEAFSGTSGVEAVEDQMQYLDPLFSALTVGTYIAVGVAALMLIAAVLLIATTIRLSAFARRREIGIMRLVGASNRFIQTPFVLEGVIAALFGSLLASAAVVAGVEFGVNGYLRGRVEFVTTWVGMTEVLYVVPVLIVIGVVLAAISAGFAIRRWLRA